jgi:D-alanyl-lipoteichoic acid acyltransferase DltB (MBOAT superfamily)
MLFNSLQFAIFFPIVTIAFFALPHRLRGPMLLIASCYFYMTFIPKYILILFFTILVDYTAGLLIDRSEGHARKLWLVTSIVANVGVLVFFKYFNFLNDTIRAIAPGISIHDPIPALNIILPIGLSFHTFQSMSYTIEVYRKNQNAERNLGRFALYVMFYPQLVAGPIERPQNLLGQFAVEHRFCYERARSGLQLMAWGLFKKVVVADRAAVIVNMAYGDPATYSGKALLFATYLFAIQIYCDFSGYSDVAIGAARVMGFDLMRNFDQPYFSRSVAEFWRRWHISLSTWFRDYVYFPLGGNRVSLRRQLFNLMAVFSLSGLWHGANWTYVIWGALNGLYLSASLLTTSIRYRFVQVSGLYRIPQLLGAVRLFVTFHLIAIAWVFFRASSLRSAIFILRSIARMRAGFGFRAVEDMNLLVIGIALLVAAELLQLRISIPRFITGMPFPLRWATYVAALLTFFLLGEFTVKQQFIYFQF